MMGTTRSWSAVLQVRSGASCRFDRYGFLMIISCVFVAVVAAPRRHVCLLPQRSTYWCAVVMLRVHTTQVVAFCV
jgi:hypothetical protein